MKKLLQSIFALFKCPKIIEPVIPKIEKPAIKIKIMTNSNTLIGVAQSLTISESRNINNDIEIKLNIPRMRIDRLRAGEVFSRGKINVSSQIYPFQIIIEDGPLHTKINNAWIESMGHVYITEDWAIIQGTQLVCESISSNII